MTKTFTIDGREVPFKEGQTIIDATHPDIFLDRDRCIFCELCVRASRDVDGKDVFAIAGRGIDTHLVVNSPSGTLQDSGMDVSDRAAGICPVGAILVKRRGFEVPLGERYSAGIVIPNKGRNLNELHGYPALQISPVGRNGSIIKWLR